MVKKETVRVRASNANFVLYVRVLVVYVLD